MSFKIDRLYELAPIHNDPLFWKEMHVGHNMPMIWPLFFTGVALSLALVLMSFLVMHDSAGIRCSHARFHFVCHFQFRTSGMSSPCS